MAGDLCALKQVTWYPRQDNEAMMFNLSGFKSAFLVALTFALFVGSDTPRLAAGLCPSG